MKKEDSKRKFYSDIRTEYGYIWTFPFPMKT